MANHHLDLDLDLDPNTRPLAQSQSAALDCLHGELRRWFSQTFPLGPTPAQQLAWPVIQAGSHALLISPTGTGKTLAAFLAILDELLRPSPSASQLPTHTGLHCVYLSPLRSLGHDVEHNLKQPLRAIADLMGAETSPVRVASRTGDTSPYHRRKLRDNPPQILITTPETLAILLSQEVWAPHWRNVRRIIVDELHSLAPSKRGADLMVSIERLAAQAQEDPQRIGLSATCRPPELLANFLVGPSRACQVLLAPPPANAPRLEIAVRSLIQADEAPHRGLSYRRLIRALKDGIDRHRTSVIFANTRAFTEKITHDLRASWKPQPDDDDQDASPIAAHHSALDIQRRRQVEHDLRRGALRAVVTSTSLELGVDIGTADLAILLGPPGSVARCLQRVGRAGHRVDVATRGLILAASAAELITALVTASAARDGDIEPIRPINGPLDVLCQQLIGMAAAREWSEDDAWNCLRRSAPFAELDRDDFRACLNFLAGDLASPAGAFEPEPGATPRWTAPRLWRSRGLFGIRSRRVALWYRRNCGTIHAEESAPVLLDGVSLGSIETSFAERLQPGDRFLLDGRVLEFRRFEKRVVHTRAAGGEANLPRWTSDRLGLSAPLALAVARFRHAAGELLAQEPLAVRGWLHETHELEPRDAEVVEGLLLAQQAISEIPDERTLLVEEWPGPDGWHYAFHAPLGRPACEALCRAVGARLGGRLGRDLSVSVADLGFALRSPPEHRLTPDDLPPLLDPEGFEEAVVRGIDRGELAARRFRFIAATALMVLKNPEGGRRQVGGLLWVSQRLYPLVKAACPDHPLLRETRRELLVDLLDVRSALDWLRHQAPRPRLRLLAGPSPFANGWIEPAAEPLRFESSSDALRRLHARLTGAREPTS